MFGRRKAAQQAPLDPLAVATRMVPSGMTSHVHEFDAHAGGSFPISLTYDAPTGTGKTTAYTDTHHGRFVKLAPNEAVVEVREFETADPAMRGEMTVTFTLTDTDGGTNVLGIHDDLPPGVSPADNKTGWRIALDKLAVLVEAGWNTQDLLHHSFVAPALERFVKSIQKEITTMKNPVLVFSLAMLSLTIGCAPASVEPLQTSNATQPTTTLEANIPLATDVPHTIAEVEELAGFDVKEPTYLPTGVLFDYATYQESPYPNVTLHYKLIHEAYGDMGAFFQIVQQPQAEALPNPTACGESGNDCELLQIGDMVVKYRLSTPTDSLMWDMDDFSFQLLRTAGEPNKIYKDELLRVVGSMK